jgi:hypothetical protein
MRSDLVKLLPNESYCGKFVAYVRTCESRKQGLGDDNSRGLWCDDLGACGEIAVAKWLGIKYIASVNTFHEYHDVGPLEVRAASRDSDRLILREKDKRVADRPFVLIVKRAPCLYRIVGWAYASGLFREEFYTNFGVENREWVYAIPQNLLNTDFSSFSSKMGEFDSPFDIIIPRKTFDSYLNDEWDSKLNEYMEAQIQHYRMIKEI